MRDPEASEQGKVQKVQRAARRGALFAIPYRPLARTPIEWDWD